MNNETIKEHIIREYFSKFDFDSDWSYHTILEELGKLLGETPAVDIQYKKDVMVNESTNKSIEISKIDKVSVIFTDPEVRSNDGSDKYRKIEFLPQKWNLP